MKASEIMVPSCVTLPQESTLEEVAKTMIERRVGSVLLVDVSGRLVGIVTESDFMAQQHLIPFSAYTMPKLFGQWVGKEGLERIYSEGRRMQAKQVMRRPVETANPDTPIEEIVEKMLRMDVRHIPIVLDDKPVGMVARKDLLALMARVLSKNP